MDDERPLHSEMGYWRPKPEGAIELVLSHPTGIVEVETGTIAGHDIELATVSLGLTPTAKQVDRLERSFHVDGDLLRYEVRMAAVDVPLTHHLSAELRRVDG